MSRGFLRATSFVGVLTLLSRVTGLARDMVYARMFPTGTGLMDAFLIAYQIPNTLRRFFAEGAFSQAFVPVVSEYRARKSHDEVRDLVDSAAGTLAAVLTLVTIIGVVLAPVLIWILAPGFDARVDGVDREQLATQMLRWTFPYLVFVSLTALAGGVLNSYGRFGIPAFTSVALNLTAIVFAVWIAPGTKSPGVTLAIGIFVAGIIQLAMQIPPLLRLKLLRRPKFNWQHEGVQRISKLMLPAIIGSSMGQISVLLSSSIATLLATGSVAWLYYADRLVEFPLGVFSIALATVILPSLSTHHADKSPAKFAATMDWALRLLCLIVLPASVALLVLAGPLTVAIFHYGQFSDEDAFMTRAALMAYSFALLGWSLVKVLAPGFFARQDTKTPMRTAMWSLGITMSLNLVFVVFAYATDRILMQGLHIVLALTNAVGAIANSWLLYRGLRKQGVMQLQAGWGALLIRMMIANLAMGAGLYFLSGNTELWLDMTTWTRI
ncbi:MAG TPA: murein biosynthesis integral membrane protein MurJ, partial [Steroidobacteraceae bacterium]|nr:murein biosynthesis integral membrane protein MurJ [Steroidobacteraceae bacterium]